MTAMLQDTFFAYILRTTTGGRVLSWPEDRDPRLQQSYLAATPRRDGPHEKSPSEESSDNESPSKESSIIIDWTDNDAANPYNWSSAKKAWVSAQICLLTTSVYIGAAIYTVGLEDIMGQFQVSQTIALLGLTLFIIGYGLGPIIWCAIAELPAVGRSPVYTATLIIFVGLQPCIIYARNIGMLLAFRFLTGFFGSPALALGGATAADMYSPQKLGYAISIWGAAAAFGPALGPVIAGYAVQYKGWTWSIWELMWLSGFCLVILIVFLPETLESNILHRRAQRLQQSLSKQGTEVVVKSRPDAEAELVDSAKEGREILLGVVTLSLFEPLILILNLYISLIYALLYLWFESFPLVFLGIHHFSIGELGLSFLGLFFGVLVGVAVYWMYVRMRIEPLYSKSATRKLTPETQMEPAMLGCFLIPISMLVFAWSSRPSVHWIVPIIGTFIFAPGVFLVFVSTITYLTAAYPKYMASVLGGNDLMRSSFGAAFPLFAGAMFKTLGIDWGNTLLACLAALFVPVPFVLVKWGGKIRKMSKKAVQDED